MWRPGSGASRGINYYYFMPGPCPCEATHTMCNAKVELLGEAELLRTVVSAEGREEGTNYHTK